MGRHRKTLEERLRDGHVDVSRHKELMAAAPPPSEIALAETPPDTLPPYGRHVWERLYGTLTTNGVLTDGERETFYAFCESAGVFDYAVGRLRDEGILIQVPAVKKGRPPTRKLSSFAEEEEQPTVQRRNPWYDIKREAMQDMLRAASLLGLTVVDRWRVKRVGEAGRNTVPGSRRKSALDKSGATAIKLAE